jgi:hypothetical protein
VPVITRNADHLAEDCRDTDCPRYPCRIYRAGRERGYREGYGEGYGDGYAAGYPAGYAAGFAAGAAAAARDR